VEGPTFKFKHIPQ
jgi:hypothetical protein